MHNTWSDAHFTPQLFVTGELWIENDGRQQRHMTLADAVCAIMPRIDRFEHFLWRPLSDVAGEARLYRDQICRLHAIVCTVRRQSTS